MEKDCGCDAPYPCPGHFEQPEGSTLSKECFYAETDTECGTCTKSNCTHYCHSAEYKLWRATDTLVSLVLLTDIRQMMHGEGDIIKQFPVLKKAANDVAKAMDIVRHNRKAPDDVNE